MLKKNEQRFENKAKVRPQNNVSSPS